MLKSKNILSADAAIVYLAGHHKIEYNINKEKPVISEVVAVGPGGVVDGNEVEMVVKVGDKVVVAKYAGTEVKLDDQEYSIVRQSEILAVVD